MHFFILFCLAIAKPACSHTTIKIDLHHRSNAAVHNVELYDNQGSEYLVNIGIGTPIQNFTVSLDTGSSDLWIPAVTCDPSECPLSRFDPAKSSTFNNDSNVPFQITYGIGSVNGTFARDEVYLANAHVSQQLFGLASSTTDLIFGGSSPSNGILGLGYPGLTTGDTKYDPFIFQLHKQGLIERPLFSVSMKEGQVVLGGIHKDHYEGEIAYEPVFQSPDENSTKTTTPSSQRTYWMVGGRSVLLKRDATLLLNTTFASVRGMIIDTGTTLTYMDPTLADTIVRTLVERDKNAVLFDRVTGTYTVDCQLGRGYSLGFVMEKGVTIEVALEDLILRQEEEEEEGVCMFGIAPWMTTGTSQKMNEKGWILVGDSVLRSTFLVFDMEQHQIGFAKPSNSGQYVTGESLSSLGTPTMAFHLVKINVGVALAIYFGIF